MTGTLSQPGVDGIVAITYPCSSIEASETPSARSSSTSSRRSTSCPGVVGTVRDRSSLRVSIWT